MPSTVPAPYWPRTARAGLTAGIAANTSAFLVRIAAASKPVGGSMATIERSVNTWLGTMSRSAPVRLVELAALLHAHRLRHGDLHVIDPVAVPDRLEQPIGETERHDALDRVLSQKVVDPEDLVLVQRAQDAGVQLARAESRLWPNGFSITTRRQNRCFPFLSSS